MPDLSGFYYLHTEGALIFKRFDEQRENDLIESDFVRYYWPFHHAKRADAWRICIEGTVAGVNADRITVMRDLWKITETDADNFAQYLRIDLIKSLKTGEYTAGVPGRGPQTSGTGRTKFAAMVALCTRLGWRPVKGAKSFEQLIRALVDA